MPSIGRKTSKLVRSVFGSSMSLLLVIALKAQPAGADTWQISAANRIAWDDTSTGTTGDCHFGDAFWLDACGLAWPVTIPPKATILSAKVRVYSDNHVGNTGAYTARIRVEDVDNAVPFIGAANDVQGRAYWSTTADWNIPVGGLPFPAWNESPDISSLIQRIVDRPGWASGNHVNIAIWGQTNSGGGGAFEDVSPFPTNPAELVVTYLPLQTLYRSAGITATDLNTGARTVQITGSTATFSAPMPASIGVGDVLVYDSGGSRLAFIHGRVSSTVYTIADKTGGAPAAAPAGTSIELYRAYTSLSNWEGQSENPNILEPTEDDVNPSTDLVGANTVMMVAVYNDGPMDDGAIQIDGWTTGPDNYIRLFAPVTASEVGFSQRHTGRAGTGFRLARSADLTATAFFRYFFIFEDFVRIEGIELDGSNLTNGRGLVAVRVDDGVSPASDLRFDKMILRDLVNSDVDPSTDSDVMGFLVRQGSVRISNTIIYNLEVLNTNPSSSPFAIEIASTNTGTSYLHNNTVYDVKSSSGNGTIARGIVRNGGTVSAINNVVLDVDSSSASEFCFVGAMTQSNNVSSDATAAGPASQINQNAYGSYFADITPGAEDLHLLNDSLTLWGSSGADLDTDPSLPVTSDIDGEFRDATAPDIGADEVVAVPLYRSVGVTATDLNTSARTVAISNTRATFSGPMPANVGVGDVLQYQVAATFYVALIHGRISSTEYRVRTAAGGAPQAAAAGTAVGVYRAYTSLFNWEAQDENDTLNNTVENFEISTNLVLNNTVMNVAAYGGGGPDTTAVTVSGWTTNATHYIRIYSPVWTNEVGASERHNGVWDTTKYRLEVASEVLRVSDRFVRIDGLQVRLTADIVNVGGIVFTGGTGVAEFEVSNSIVRGNGVGVQDIRIGVNLYQMGSGVLKLWNNVIYDWAGGTNFVSGIVPDDPNFTYYISNNTVVDCGAGIESLQGTVVARNNLVYNSSDISYSGLFSGSSNNLSGPILGGAPGASPRNSVTVAFVNAAADDFHLASGDTGAQNFGADLSSDLDLAFTGDIDLGLRTAPWDIGADDVLATTAVELSRFTATGYDSEVLLEWETGSELDNLGFHLYRAISGEGNYERITTEVIPGLGSSPAGARYRYRDEGLVNGRSYSYQLEDIETTGKTERHGPVVATPASGVSGESVEPDPGDASRSLITFGDPRRNTFRVLVRSPSEVVVELRTEGVYAEPLEDGTVRITVPDFQEIAEAGAPEIPVSRRWLDVVAGRKVRLGPVRVEAVETLDGWRPSSTARAELQADARGSVRLSRRRTRSSPVSGWYPREAARIVEVGFQRDAKKALVELSPLRWDASTGRLYLARRLEVRLSFSGIEAGETSAEKRRGRVGPGSGAARSKRPVVRLVTREPGLYAVSYEDVFGRKHSGAEVVRLSRGGDEVAYHIEPRADRFQPDTTLFFLSDGADANPNGNEAVYELELAPGRHMPVREAEATGSTIPRAWHRLHREESHLYQPALVDAPDLWLWDAVFAPATRDYPFALPGLAPSNDVSFLVVRLQGVSDFEASPDHHVRLFLNETFLGEGWVEGKDFREIEAEIPPGILREGENLLQVENVGDTGAAYSMLLLDDFDVVYLRETAVDDTGILEARWNESGVARVPGASMALDVTEATPRWIRGERIDGEDSFRFQTEPGRRYLALSEEGLRRPVVRSVPRTTLQDRHPQTDYLILGPRAFLDAAKPLVSHRISQGLSVRTAAVEDIASEFGFGESSPEAIRSFLAYAYHDWEPPSLRYLLLLGDATYDPKDYLGTGTTNDVPSTRIRTRYLWTVSDLAYASVNGDDELPDLAIGRLPVSSVEEVRESVAKILLYEASGIGLGDRVVLVTDNPDGGGDFVSEAEELSRTVLAGRNPDKIYLSQRGLEATRRAVRQAFDEGASLMSYLGHGGIHLWASEQILTNTDVPSLSPQRRQPILLTLNCLNGYYQFPYFDSLSEELLKPSDRGVIAAFSPSGFSLDAPAHRLHQMLLGELLSGRHSRLGDAILAAQESYAAAGAYPELLEIYHLLGDPALRLH